MAWIDYKKAYNTVPKSWILDYLKMYKISDQLVQFRRPWKPEKWNWQQEEKSLSGVKVQRGIFQGDAQSPLLFGIAMMPPNHILRKHPAGYKLSEKDQPLDVHERHQTFCQKRKRIINPNTDCVNIQSRYRNGIWLRKMYHASNDGRSRTTKSRKTPSNKWKWTNELKKSISEKPESYSRQNSIKRTCQRDKYLSCLPRKILGTILVLRK